MPCGQWPGRPAALRCLGWALRYAESYPGEEGEERECRGTGVSVYILTVAKSSEADMAST